MKDRILRFLELPTEERPRAAFIPAFLEYSPALSGDERFRLKTLFPKGPGLPKDKLYGYLYSLAYGSSRLEGNTYSELETITLLEDRLAAEDRSVAEARMIMNHGNAFELLRKAQGVDRVLIEGIHARLADDTGARGSHHFLEPEHCGKVRSYDAITIRGSQYEPLTDYPGRRPSISDHLDGIIKTSEMIKEPLEQAFYLFTRLPYLQPFRDCNKRTSRMIGNLPLLQGYEYPISFAGVEASDYNRGILAFYELGDTKVFKEIFLNAYIRSALSLHRLAESFHEGFGPISNASIAPHIYEFVSKGKLNPIAAALQDSNQEMAERQAVIDNELRKRTSQH
ncbi:Fic family protein [Pseudomonas aeruginosa]